MPPQARFEGVVDEEPTTWALSERTNPSLRKIPARFLLVEDPMKAPMNPEEVHLMKWGERMIERSKKEAKQFRKSSPQQCEAPFAMAPTSRKKKLAKSFFQRFSKSRLLSSIQRDQ